MVSMTGQHVRRIRKRLGLTQVGLAELLGTTGNSVARWERDEVRVLPTTARLLELIARQHHIRPSRRRKGA